MDADDFISPVDLMDNATHFADWCIANEFIGKVKNNYIVWTHKEHQLGDLTTYDLYNTFRKTRVEKLRNRHYGN